MTRTFAAVSFSAISLLVTGVGHQVATAAEPPVAASPQSASLRAAVADPRVRRFYELRQWRPAWSREAGQALVQTIGQGRRHGFDPARFLGPVEAAGDGASREAALSLAAINYAQALAIGLAEPDKLHGIYTLDRPRMDVSAGLARAVDSRNVAGWLESLAPQDAEYRALSEAYLRNAQGGGQAIAVPGGPLIRVGSKDARVPLVAEALRAAGYLSGSEIPTTYTQAMADAVKRLQSERGLDADGLVGPGTLAALNAGAASPQQARQLAINLERRRWLAREVPQRRVDVNTAAAVLDYYRDGQRAWSTRVVAGAPKTPTPALGSPITRLVVNPPWYVPESIARKEILPKGAAYLRRNAMYVKDGTVIQRPGPQAALGQVKFDMDNPYAIYLHDTPAKALFERDERHKSHGCVRVQNALEFARMLAAEQGAEAIFDEKLATGKTAVVNVNELPVRLLYHTAYVDGAGQVVYRPDAYGWDAELAKALGL
jgi:murein L,D-transpeptidase YcbB/YkuD